jgi:hypothetical protein
MKACNRCGLVWDSDIEMCGRCGYAETAPSSVPAQCDCSAWEVGYDMFLRDDYTKKEKIAKRLNEGWTEMGMLPWVVEGKDAGFHVWWKRQNRGIVMSKKGDEKPAKKVTEIKVYPAAQFHIKLSDKMTAQEIKKVEKALEIPFSGVVRIQAFAHRVIITNTLSEDHHEEMKPIFTAAIEKALAK